MQSHDAVIRVYDDAGNIVEIDCPSFPVPVPVLSDAHVEWRVLFVCAARFDYFDLTSKTKRRGGHDRNCSNNSWPNERQIEVLAAGLQKGGGSLNKPHRKWSLTNSKLRSPKNSIRHLTSNPKLLSTLPLSELVRVLVCLIHVPSSIRSAAKRKAVATTEGHAATRPSLTDNRP